MRTIRVAVALTAALTLWSSYVPTAGATPRRMQTAGASPRRMQTAGAAGTALSTAAAAGAAAGWIARQLTGGYLPGPNPGAPDISGTVSAIIDLAAVHAGAAQVTSALDFLGQGGVNPFVDIGPNGADGPGQLALLILATHAAGVDPHTFLGTDLVRRLLFTERTSGPDTGLFGVQDPTFDGAYRQGLSLAALAAVGVTSGAPVSSAVAWLRQQQCDNGGWTSYRTSTVTPCAPVDPVTFTGPDTNSTALAVEGLVAQHQPAAHDPIAFLTAAQGTDGGWAFLGGAGQASDADSTALVLQALAASGISPADPRFQHGRRGPVAALLSFQNPCTGAFAFQPNPDGTLTPNRLATEQAVPALAGLALPFGPDALGPSVPGAPCPYWLASADGGVFSYAATFAGSLGGHRINAPVVGMAPTPSGKGYWLVAADGGVFSFGDAAYYGSAGSLRLNRPIVGMAATADGHGYWLVAADGGVFSYGDAMFHGSAGGLTLNRPIVGMAATADGGGYWLVASDGGVFSYGDAIFHGSAASLPLSGPVVGMTPTRSGKGYWLVSADGGVFSYGDAAFYGSAGGFTLNRPIVGMAATVDGGGYWLVASDGGVFTYGTAAFFGSAASLPLSQPIVAVAASTLPPGG